MERPINSSLARRLIVNADDFGFSSTVNEAVVRAHRQGILTSASLMVNEPACQEAVALAREHPGMGVGLHLSLVCGRAALPPDQIPGLAGADGAFCNDPIRTGCAYFFQSRLRSQLEREINAQFARFQATGLKLDHVNGHLNMHLHPTIFNILMNQAKTWGIRHFRLVRDPFGLNAQLAGGQWFYRVSHALIFGLLAHRARPLLEARGIRFTGAVFGLLQNARMGEDYLAALLPRLPGDASEIYAHPSLDRAPSELAALCSDRVKKLVHSLHLKLIRYQDL